MFNSLALLTSPTEWMILGVIVLVLFGGSRIPEMMRGLGSGVKEFKKGIREDDEPAPKKEEEKKEPAVKD
jgi:sec-independent protein translocase protein TatA